MSAPGVGAVLVGGAGRRMGGVAKGLLPAPSGEPIALALTRAFEAIGWEPVLVGDAVAYAALGLRAVADEPAGVGPIGGLCAALGYAGERCVIVVGCDMPFVDAATLAALAAHPSRAPALAPREADRWEPLLSRWDAARCVAAVRAEIARGTRSLQRACDAVGAERWPMELAARRALVDWDEPGDLARARPDPLRSP